MFAVQKCMVMTNPTMACIVWLAFVTAVWIFFLFAGQIAMIAGETTTFEVFLQQLLLRRLTASDFAVQQQWTEPVHSQRHPQYWEVLVDGRIFRS